VKLYETKFWNEYNKFEKIVHASSMRCTVDAYIYYKIFKKYDFKRILEIGFYQGQTAGLIAEITADDARITCLDPNPRCEILDLIYADLKFKIDLHQIKSQNFDFNFEFYDIIIIDGCKEFSSISVDIQHSVKSIDQNGMILVNEYQKDSVQAAINQHMLPNGLVPFLQTDQTLFFHYPTCDRGNFIDFELIDPGFNFINFTNKDIFGHTVLHATTLPIFSYRMDFYNMALREFDV
jgi:Methyltransferase domain